VIDGGDSRESRNALIRARPYVPILKGKQGERLALRDLDASIRSALTPAFQLLPGRDAAAATRELRQIGQGWTGVSPIFVDASWATWSAASDHPLVVASEASATAGLSLVPMVGPGNDSNYLDAARTVSGIHRSGAGSAFHPSAGYRRRRPRWSTRCWQP
jgi:hypothetical protein